MKKSSDSNRGIGQVPNSQIADWGSGARPTVSQTAINAVVTETNQIINHTGNSHPSAVDAEHHGDSGQTLKVIFTP